MIGTAPLGPTRGRGNGESTFVSVACLRYMFLLHFCFAGVHGACIVKDVRSWQSNSEVLGIVVGRMVALTWLRHQCCQPPHSDLSGVLGLCAKRGCPCSPGATLSPFVSSLLCSISACGLTLASSRQSVMLQTSVSQQFVPRFTSVGQVLFVHIVNIHLCFAVSRHAALLWPARTRALCCKLVSHSSLCRGSHQLDKYYCAHC
jgi:hypothetical protein